MLSLRALKRFAAAGLALLLAGCAWSELASAPQSARTGKAGDAGSGKEQAGRPLTPAEKRMRAQSRNFDRTVWEGVVFGAAGVALVTVLSGKDAWKGAAASAVAQGAALGAVGGGVGGAYVALKQREYANREDQLESMIADLRKINRETEEYIETVRTVVAADKRKLSVANDRHRKGLITLERLRKEQAAVADNRRIMTESVEGAREKKRILRSAEQQFSGQNPDFDTRTLRQEVETLSNQIETLDAIVGELDVA